MAARLLLLVALAAACGSDDDAVGGDAGQVGDGSPRADGAGVDAAGPRRIADSVLFIQRGGPVAIRFSDQPDGVGSCFSEPVAGCELQTCMPGIAEPPHPDAGLISVTPETSTGQSYLPADDGVYPGSPAVTWEDGEAIAIEADGGEVPAFRVDATGPGDVETVVSPPLTNPTIRRDEALLVEWTGAESFVAIALSCTVTPDFFQLRCPFPDGTTGEVPVVALQRLPACAMANLFVFTEDRQVIEPGPEWPIRIGVRGAIRSTQANIE
jgi:hypothetical protein